MVALKSCCWCLSLATGCKIIAVLQIVWPIFYYLLGSGQLEAAVLYTWICSVTAGGVLLYATIKEDRHLLSFWLITNAVFFIMGVVLSLIYCVAMVTSAFEDTQEIVVCFVSELIAAVFGFMLLFVVYSFIDELRRREEQESKNCLI